MAEDTPRVKQLITYYETAAAEDRESAKALKERRKAERAEKRRSRQIAKLQQQEMRSPKSKKFKVSSPATKKQRAIVLQEPPEELQAPLLEAFVELAPLPAPLFEPSPQEIAQLEQIPIEEKVAEPEIDALPAPEEPQQAEEEEVVVEVDLQVTVSIHPAHSEPVQTEKEIEVAESEIFEELEVESKVEEAPKEEEPVAEPAVVASVPATPRSDHRTFVAREILTTERTYVDGLRNCISNYMTPLTSKIDDKDLAQIFGNLPNILRLNETLLGQLECRLAEWSDTTVLGDVFIELAPFLSMYADYCVTYETAAQLVAKYKQTTNVFKELQEKNLAGSGGVGPDILDFLIMPVQRVPRYRLLLEQLLKYTPEDHADYASVKQASAIVSDKATEINHKMALVNQQKKLMELSTRFETVPLSEGLVQPYRHFVSEFTIEWIPSFDSTESKNVHLFLLNDLMLLAPVPKQADDKLVCLGAYPLWSVFLKKLDDSWALSKRENPPFQLVHSSATYNLLITCADTKQKFKVELEAQREKLLTSHPQLKTKRLAIKLEMNHPKQEWSAVEPAPLFASRISQQSLAKEAAEFTQRALEELLRENKQALESMPATPAGKTPKKSRLFQLKETVVAAFSPLKTPGKRRDSLGGGAGLFGHSPSAPRFATMRGSTSYPNAGSESGGALFASVAEALTSDTAVASASAPVISVEGVSQADLVRQQIEELNKKAAEITRKEQKKQERKRKREEAEAEAAAAAAAAAEEAAKEAAKAQKKKEKKHKREQSAVVAPTVEPEEPKEAKKSKKHKREHSENTINEATASLDPVMQPSEKKRRKKQDNLAVLPPPEPLMLPTMIFAQVSEVEKPEEAQAEEKPEKKHRSKKHRQETVEAEAEPAPLAAVAEAPIVEEKKHRGKKSKPEPVAETPVEVVSEKKTHKKLKSSTSDEDLRSSSKKHKSSKRDLAVAVAETKENAGENKTATPSSRKRKAEAITPAPATEETPSKKSSKRKLAEITPSKSHKSHKVASN